VSDWLAVRLTLPTFLLYLSRAIFLPLAFFTTFSFVFLLSFPLLQPVFSFIVLYNSHAPFLLLLLPVSDWMLLFTLPFVCFEILDQLKTNIQRGLFKHVGEAIKYQHANAGISALYGRAAVIRGLYVGHGVLSLNFARDKVEKFIHNC
jgi:hypothetical protein